MIKENLLSLKKTFSMALIDLKKVYRGTLLGWFWLIAKPAATIFVYWFAFSIGLKVGKPVNGEPYFIWLIVGLLPWFYMSDIINSSPTIYKKYNYLVTKMKYPVSTIPVFSSLSRLIVHILLLTLFSIIYIIQGGKIDSYLFQLPLLVIISFTFMAVIAISLALIGSISKDLANFVKTISTPLMFLSPIIWNIENISIGWLVAIQHANPIYFLVNSYRDVFIHKKWFFSDTYSLALFTLIFILNVIIASSLYSKLKKEIPDYV